MDSLATQTKKLFEVARLRRLPLFTFVNKLDRPSRTPYATCSAQPHPMAPRLSPCPPPLPRGRYELCDEIEAEFDVVPCPVLWPIGSGESFKGTPLGIATLGIEPESVEAWSGRR